MTVLHASDSPKHIYISGPMRGRAGFNFPEFMAAEAEVHGFYPEADICNPAREDVVHFGLQGHLALDPTGLTAGQYLMDTPGLFTDDGLHDALARDLDFICRKCDLMVMLPGWEGSKGATAEKATADALGVPVVMFRSNAEIAFAGLAAARAPEDTGEAASVAPSPGSGSPERPFGTAPAYLAVEPQPIDTNFRLMESHGTSGETRATSSTGGQKGVKLAEFGTVSPEVEVLIAEHFGKGSRKYAPHNFRKGYPWSQSYAALRRHLADFWLGKEYDTCPEDGHGCAPAPWDAEPGTCFNHTGSLHIVAVAWHAQVLTEFFLHHPEFDDRYWSPNGEARMTGREESL